MPYVSLIYRYGVGGVILLWGVGGVWFLGWLRRLRRLPLSYQPLVLVIVVLGIELLLAAGQSLDSAGPAMFGIWVAVLEAVARLPAEPANHPPSRQPVLGAIHGAQEIV